MAQTLQEMAAAALRLMEPAPEAADPGPAPAKDASEADKRKYASSHDAHVAFLMEKAPGQLTAAEQKTLMAAALRALTE